MNELLNINTIIIIIISFIISFRDNKIYLYWKNL